MRPMFLLLGLVLALAGPAQAQTKSITQPLQIAQTGNADGLSIPVDNYSSVSVQVNITGTATVSFEGTQDQSTWSPVACIQVGDTTYSSITSTASTMTVRCNVAGLVRFRTPTSGNTGTVGVTATASPAVMGSGGGGGGGGGSTTLQGAFTNGKEITGANSLANAFRFGDGATPGCAYTDAALGGPVIRPCEDSDAKTFIWENFDWCLFDIEGNRCVLTVDPDATDNNKYVWTSGYRPIKTLTLTADALYTQGSAALVTSSALVSGGLTSPYITITDSNSDGFHRYLTMDPKWDGGTVTATVTVVNTNATPANAFVVHVSGACYPAGTEVATTISTTGEQSATITFGSSGSCGASACDQNDPASATTAAITINGTPAGGNWCGFQAQVDASGTTETVTGIKVTQLDIHYKISKGF